MTPALNVTGLPEMELPKPWFDRQVLIDEGYSEGAIECLFTNWEYVRTKYVAGKIKTEYNIRLRTDDVDVGVIRELLENIHELQTQAYRVNIGFGSLLQHADTEEWRYFYPINPSKRYFARPLHIRKLDDLRKALEYMDAEDIHDHLTIQRDNTKYILRRVVCFNVVVYTIPEQPLLGNPIKLPDHIINHKFIQTLRMRSDNKPYKDNMCAFRCLSYHLNGGVKLQAHAKRLAEEFRKYMAIPRSKFTKEITIEQLYHVEKCFGVKISVYTLSPLSDEAESKTTKWRACLIRRSPRTLAQSRNGELFLDCTADHLSVITSIENYAHSFACNQCNALFKDRYTCRIHQNKCYKLKNRAVFVGGAYRPQPDIFRGLAQLGFHINADEKFCKYYTAFDFETTSQIFDDDRQNKLQFKRLLELVSCSINSSVPGFQKVHFIRRYTTVNEFMGRFVEYLCSIAVESEKLQLEKLDYLFVEIRTRLDQIESEIRCSADDDVRDFLKCKMTQIQRIQTDLLNYAKMHVVYAFNGSRFDLKVSREYLIEQLFERKIEIKNVIKRQGAYSLLETATLVFKDMASLLGPGTSLENFFRTFNLPVTKWAFPYSYITSLETLDQIDFPPYSAFWNSLKNKYLVTEEGYKEIEVWYRQNASSLWDYLKEYNNRDVISMIPGLEKLRCFWQNYGICMISTGISLSSLSSRLMFNLVSDDKPFVWLPDKNSSFVFELLSKSIVGGPALVWTRYAERHITFIRGGPNKCQSILGLDAAALYLYCLSKPMPTSYPVSWHENPTTGFFERKVLIPKWTSVQEIEYCFWIQHSTKDPELCHVYNNKQQTFGKRKYRPDAYSARDNKIYHFFGCWWHFHENCVVGQKRALNEPTKAKTVREENEEMIKYFRKLGFEQEVVFGCQWRELKKSNKLISAFTETKLTVPLRYQRNIKSKDDLIDKIVSGELFGLAKVSLHAPDDHFETFREFCPIFLKRLITRNDLSPYALKIAEQNDLLKHGRTSLISVMKAKNIVLITPLIKWYVQHGMVIDDISDVVQFKPAYLFPEFTENVTFHRKLSDEDPSKKDLGEMHKLTGNAGYGKTLERKSEFVNIRFKNEAEASKFINKPEFVDLEEINDDLYEITTIKKRYLETVPRQIGAFVLGYAKLRLLEMYYDFLDRFWDRSHWELICADTDSLYMSINADSLESFEKLVREEKLDEYHHQRNQFLSTDKSTQRQPGLFKVEFHGSGIVSLCPKMYFAWNDDDMKEKKSCKGINQRDELVRESYMQVLKTKTDLELENRGLRFYKGKMYEYVQQKRGLINFYIK